MSSTLLSLFIFRNCPIVDFCPASQKAHSEIDFFPFFPCRVSLQAFRLLTCTPFVERTRHNPTGALRVGPPLLYLRFPSLGMYPLPTDARFFYQRGDLHPGLRSLPFPLYFTSLDSFVLLSLFMDFSFLPAFPVPRKVKPLSLPSFVQVPPSWFPHSSAFSDCFFLPRLPDREVGMPWMRSFQSPPRERERSPSGKFGRSPLP